MTGKEDKVTCATCRFVGVDAYNDAAEVCRRDPPSGNAHYASWPIVKPAKDWCAYHEPAPQPLSLLDDLKNFFRGSYQPEVKVG